MPTRLVETSPNRIQLEGIKEGLSPSVPVTVANTHTCDQGNVLGKITASGKYRRRSRSAVGSTAFGTGSPNGSVVDGTLFKVGDVLTNAAGAAVGTILSITGNNIVLTANAANAVATGAHVLASDGSQVADVISDKASDGVGDTTLNAFVGGYLAEAKLIGIDSTAKTELGGRSTANGIFRF